VPDEDEKLVSLSGSPIYRHAQPEPGFHPPETAGRFLPEISDHIERHIGPIESVFHEIVSEFAHIDVHWVPPNPKRKFHTLISSGMSDSPMNLPEGVDAPEFAELHITLPAEWSISQHAFQEEANYWPIRLLKTLARFPSVHQTWLGYGHSLPNGDPPEPYDGSTELSGAVILLSPSVPEGFRVLRSGSGEEIFFLAVVPVHQDEMDYKLRRGVESLTDRFDAKGVSDLIDPGRESACRRRRWNPFS
jgi:hypothetical protein